MIESLDNYTLIQQLGTCLEFNNQGRLLQLDAEFPILSRIYCFWGAAPRAFYTIPKLREIIKRDHKTPPYNAPDTEPGDTPTLFPFIKTVKGAPETVDMFKRHVNSLPSFASIMKQAPIQLVKLLKPVEDYPPPSSELGDLNRYMYISLVWLPRSLQLDCLSFLC